MTEGGNIFQKGRVSNNSKQYANQFTDQQRMIGFWGRVTSIDGKILSLAPVVMDKTCEMNPFDPLFDPNAPVEPVDPPTDGDETVIVAAATTGGSLLSIVLVSFGILLAVCTLVGLITGLVLVWRNRRKEKAMVHDLNQSQQVVLVPETGSAIGDMSFDHANQTKTQIKPLEGTIKINDEEACQPVKDGDEKQDEYMKAQVETSLVEDYLVK